MNKNDTVEKYNFIEHLRKDLFRISCKNFWQMFNSCFQIFTKFNCKLRNEIIFRRNMFWNFDVNNSVFAAHFRENPAEAGFVHLFDKFRGKRQFAFSIFFQNPSAARRTRIFTWAFYHSLNVAASYYTRCSRPKQAYSVFYFLQRISRAKCW